MSVFAFKKLVNYLVRSTGVHSLVRQTWHGWLRIQSNARKTTIAPFTNFATFKKANSVTTTCILIPLSSVRFIMAAPRDTFEEMKEKMKQSKDKYLNMELDEKRKLYKCGDEYLTLPNILTWAEYFVKERVQPAGDDMEGLKYETNDVFNSKVSLWQGDITALEIDCIVNAANSGLMPGGGVCGAIHRSAGSTLANECRVIGSCPTGESRITGGYRLPAKHVIHTVGPQEENPDALRSCYETSLQLLIDNDLRSIAFPCIATGIYGYPRVGAAKMALGTVRDFLEKNPDKVDRVIFTVFLEEDKEVYEELMQKYFPLK